MTSYDTVNNVLWPREEKPPLKKCKMCGDEFPIYELENGICDGCERISRGELIETK